LWALLDSRSKPAEERDEKKNKIDKLKNVTHNSILYFYTKEAMSTGLD